MDSSLQRLYYGPTFWSSILSTVWKLPTGRMGRFREEATKRQTALERVILGEGLNDFMFTNCVQNKALPSTTSTHFRFTLGMPYQFEDAPSAEAVDPGERTLGVLLVEP